MMKSAFWRVTALALVALLVFPTIVPGLALAGGTEAKHSALSGSLLHSTTAELNAFAHKGANMDGFAEITSGNYPSGNAGSSGSARLLFGIGENYSLHFQAHDNGFPARGLDYMWGGTSTSSAGVFNFFEAPAQIVEADLIGSGASVAWSAGLSVAQTKDEVSTNDGTTETSDKENVTGYALRASVGNENFDAGAEVAIISATDEETETGEEPDKSEPSETAFGAWAQIQQENWTFIGAVGIGTSDDDVDGTDDPSMFSLLGVAGYHFKNDDQGHVTGQFHIEYMKMSDLPVDGDILDQSALYIPGCEVAVDHAVSDRFRVYVAADAAYVITNDEFVNAEVTTDTAEVKGSFFNFEWTAGLGFAIWDNVMLDFVFNVNNLDQLLSIGNEDPMIAQFSAHVGLN